MTLVIESTKGHTMNTPTLDEARAAYKAARDDAVAADAAYAAAHAAYVTAHEAVTDAWEAYEAARAVADAATVRDAARKATR